jgi:hypothetical protein
MCPPSANAAGPVVNPCLLSSGRSFRYLRPLENGHAHQDSRYSTSGVSALHVAKFGSSVLPPARSRGFDLACDEAAADDLTVDLIGTLPNLGDLGIAHQPLDPKILHVAIAAMELHSLSGNVHGKVGGSHL